MLPERIDSKIMKVDDGCWLWNASIQGAGYGTVQWRGKVQLAHRVVYEILVGPLPDPDHLQCDHLCRVRACVNPAHIELVTAKKNTQRGIRNSRSWTWQSDRTHCVNGHEFTERNTRMTKEGWRTCRACNAAAVRRYESKVVDR